MSWNPALSCTVHPRNRGCIVVNKHDIKKFYQQNCDLNNDFLSLKTPITLLLDVNQ